MLKYEEAIAAYDKAIELDPQCTEAYLGKWYILDELGKNTEALKVYIALDKNPKTDSYIHFQSGNALDNLGRHEEAIVACNKAIELKPDYVGASHQRSLSYPQRG